VRTTASTTPDLALPLVVTLAWLAGATAARRVGLWLGLGGAAILLAAVLLVVDRRRLRALFSLAPRPIILGALAGGVATLLTRPLYVAVTRVAPAVASDVARLYGHLDATTPAWASLALMLVVVAEELVWRGAVQGALERRVGAGAGALLAAALYALALAPISSPVLVLVAFTCGLLWSGLRAATGSLVAPLIAHLVWDQVVLNIAPVLAPLQ
jgi:membrane protease YdiL (CAAX protease family)